MKNPEVIWKVRGRRLDVSRRGMVMGILNVTPDSFSDGGCFGDPVRALEQARRMIGEGAEIIDVGGESTRPGADPVGEAEELRRTTPVVAGRSSDPARATMADRCSGALALPSSIPR
jgi:dihydropteroate synthase